ncbi:MAG: HEAT repeat domain-containing protein [Kiritimatiellae bacterium]|nr:HEAT repeat domain-containing protein [Kiritimatiellia bacterium]
MKAWFAVAACVATAALCVPGMPAAGAETANARLTALLDGVPAKDADSRAVLVRDLIALGSAGIAELAGLLVEPGTGDDTKPRMALHAMAVHAASPDGDAIRPAFERVLLSAIEQDRPAPVKAFLLEQLRFVAGAASVAPLGTLLTHETLCEPAVQVLLSLRAADPSAVLRHALRQAHGAARLTLLNALGQLRDKEAVPLLVKDAVSQDRETRLTALYALANIGEPATQRILAEAAGAESLYERARATEHYFLFVRRLAEAGRREQAVGLCREFMAARADKPHVQCGGLACLATLLGLDVVDDLMKAMLGDNVELRAAAEQIAVAWPGPDATRKWLAELERRTPAEQARILRVLRKRRDPAALPAILAAARAQNGEVRLAALDSLGSFDDPSVIAPLVKALTTGADDERSAAARSLEQLPGETAIAALIAALPGADDAGRLRIVRLLAAPRGASVVPTLLKMAEDPVEDVRCEALRGLARLADEPAVPALVKLLVNARSTGERNDAEKAVVAACKRGDAREERAAPVIAALSTAAVPAQCALLRVLGKIDGRAALATVRAALTHADSVIQTTAVRTLKDWPNADPMPDLLALARNAAQPIHRVLAVQGYVRMIGLESKRPPAQTRALYETAMTIAERVEEKKTVLAGMARVSDPGALAFVASYLDNEPMRDEALAASLKIAVALSSTHPDTAEAALNKLLALSQDEKLRKQAEDALEDIRKYEGYITCWAVSGPFTASGKELTDLLDIPFPPEQAGAKGVKWRTLAGGSDPSKDWFIDLAKTVGGKNCVAYMKTLINSPAKQEAILELGSDDGIKAALNGKVVHVKNAPRALKPGEDRIKVVLNQGRNTLFLKVSQGSGDWAACARLRKADGGRLDGVRFATE